MRGEPSHTGHRRHPVRGGDKATWIKRGYLKTFARYPKVKTIMYQDADKPHLNVSHPG
mgnify:CR=1 FL=1